MEIISTELILKDEEYVDKRLEDLVSKIKRQNDKDSREEKEVLDKVKELLANKKWVKTGDWHFKEIEVLNKHYFITVANFLSLLSIALFRAKTWFT